jgi:hypothetical protein
VRVSLTRITEPLVPPPEDLGGGHGRAPWCPTDVPAGQDTRPLGVGRGDEVPGYACESLTDLWGPTSEQLMGPHTRLPKPTRARTQIDRLRDGGVSSPASPRG